MPIRPENRALYPPDWPKISRQIRFERAGGRCECRGECGSTHPVPEHPWSAPAGYVPGEKRCPRTHGAILTNVRTRAEMRVVLTVAHLNHDPGDCRDENLRAMCQACHLTYDAHQHARNAATTRMRMREAAGQLRLDPHAV